MASPARHTHDLLPGGMQDLLPKSGNASRGTINEDWNVLVSALAPQQSSDRNEYE
jgi:hypothetical protein